MASNPSLSGLISPGVTLEIPSAKISGLSTSPTASPIRIPSISMLPPKISPIVQPSTPLFSQRMNPIVPPVPSVLSGPSATVGPMVPSMNQFVLQPPVPSGPSIPLVPSTAISPVPVDLPIPLVPSPTTSVQFLPSNLMNQNIENKLLDLGYTPKETIIRKLSDSQREAKYIRAIDNRGNSVLIELNVESNIAVQPSDLTTVESSPVISIPYSIRSGIFEAAGKQISGVAYDCTSGICIMSNDPVTMKPVDKFLTIVEKPSARVALEQDSFLASPIIKLSDIIENPTLINNIVQTATENIRKAVLKAFSSDLDINQRSFDQLTSKVPNTLRAMSIAMTKIVTSLEVYEKARKVYDINPPVTQQAKNEYDLIVLNIRKRQDMIRRLLATTKSLELIRNKFNELSADMDNIIRDLDNNYTDVDKRLYKV